MKSIGIYKGDLLIRDKRLQMAEGKQQIIQKIVGNLSIYKDELFYNADIGIDRNMLFPEDKSLDTNEMKQLAIVEALSDIDEIESIENFNFIKEDRKVLVNLKIKLKTGEIIETGGIDIG